MCRIHGTDGNPIMEIASKTGTALHVWDEASMSFDQDGKLVDDAEADVYNELLWGDDGLLSAAFRYSAANQNTIDPSRSLYDFLVERSQEFFTHDPVEVANRRRRDFLQYVCLWGAYIGSPVTRQSLRFFWLEECIHGENPFVAGTYSRILSHIGQPAVDRAEIRLQCEIVKVRAGGLNDEEGSARPSLVTAGGDVLQFDEVIVTVPLGFLKLSKKMFEPPLPDRLSHAIDNISYGTLDKVYITFPSAWWTGGSNTRKDMSTNGEKSAHRPAFIQWLQPEYSARSNSSKWMQEAMNLAALRSDCAHPTLLFYIQGPQSQFIADIVKSHPSDQERDAKLVDFFKPYFSLLPNYNDSDPACAPNAILATAWANDRLAGYGSYANFQVGLCKGDEDIEVMREGMPDRRTWLAGEHTAPFVALGMQNLFSNLCLNKTC